MERDPRRGGWEATALSDAIEAFLKQSGLYRGLQDQRVLDAWTRAAGPTLGPHARPVRFQRGQLWVQVDSSPHLHELQNFTGERLRAKANELLGEERIRRVTFKLQGRP
jgi:hypothetical protein